MNKRFWVLVIVPVLLISFISSTFAVTAPVTTTSTTTAPATTPAIAVDTSPSYTLLPLVEENKEGTEVKVTLSLKDDFKWDPTGGAIYMNYNKDLVTYKSIDKGTLIWTTDILDGSNTKDWIGVFEFTSDGNKDKSWTLLIATFTKSSTSKVGDKLTFEVVETSGTNKSELLVDGATIKVSGKTDYTTVGSTSPVTTGAVITTPIVSTPVVPTPPVVNPVVTAPLSTSVVTPVVTSVGESINSDTTKTKTGVESYLFLSILLLIVSWVLVIKNKQSI